MKNVTPWLILIVRGLAGLLLIGISAHLFAGATAARLPYRIGGWGIVGALTLILFLSWVRKPFSAYIIAFFVPMLPTVFFICLWLIVLKTSAVWEFLLVCGAFLSLPITLSVQIIRSPATRDFFHFSRDTTSIKKAG